MTTQINIDSPEVHQVVTLFGQIRIVQDYPLKYKNESPRRHHETYLEALREGFLFCRHIHRSTHYHPVVMVKPSPKLLEVWEASRYTGYGFGAMTISEFQANPSLYRIEVTYMSGIGRKTIGYVKVEEWEAVQADQLSIFNYS